MSKIDELRALARDADDVQKPVFEAAIAALEALEPEPEPEPEGLFGRWARYTGAVEDIPPQVLIVSDHPDNDGLVQVYYRDDERAEGAGDTFVYLDNLVVDPATLTTEQDFKNAPRGTVVAKNGRVWVRVCNGWDSNNGETWHPGDMADYGECTVLCWGWGE